jgi:Fur family ferric uptake transcriptional regulator
VTPADGAHLAAVERLQAVDQRYTAGRRTLVDVLCAAGRPVSLPEVIAAGRGMAQSSAYRNLVVLEQAGVVRRVLGADEFARFELAEDLVEHHHHLVCQGCGTVSDFVAPPALEEAMVHALQEVAAASGFATESHRLDLLGLCRDCS